MTHQENQSNLFNSIQKITIENFQSHKETSLSPAGPGQLTVIVGQSRQGKTAIFRALRWLFYNAPDGADFIRWSATFARVTVEYADGTQVIRYRNSGWVNRYIIRKPDQQEQVYEGFGRGAVPLEVQQVTGVSTVEIGEGLSLNLNLAEQLDGPFLGNKSVSSTARAKVLGKLAGTEEVDLAGKTLGTDLYRWKRDQESYNKEIKGLGDQLKGYDYLPEFKANVDSLAGIRDAVKAAMERREKLSVLHTSLTNTNEAISKHSQLIQRLGNIIVGSERIQIIAIGHVARHSHCLSLKAEWNQNFASLEAVQAVIKRTDSLPQAEALIRTTEGQMTRQQQAETIITRWNKMVYDRCQVETILQGTERVFTAETLVNFAKMNAAQLTRLIPLSQKLGLVKVEKWKVEWVLDTTEHIPFVDNSLTELYDKMGRKNRLVGVLDKLNQSNGDMAVVDRQLERTKGIGTAESLVSAVEKNIVNNKWLTNIIWNLDTYKKQIMTESIIAENAGKEVEKLQTEYYEVLKRAGKCPLCNGDIDREKIKEII